GARQPVDLVHHDDVDSAGCHFRQQPLQRGTLHATARKSAIIVGGLHKPPAFVCLALYIRLARLALSMQGVERLFQTLLARLPRIDGATAKRGHDLRFCRRPKKRGPDQRVPVMRWAMADNESCFWPF